MPHGRWSGNEPIAPQRGQSVRNSGICAKPARIEGIDRAGIMRIMWIVCMRPPCSRRQPLRSCHAIGSGSRHIALTPETVPCLQMMFLARLPGSLAPSACAAPVGWCSWPGDPQPRSPARAAAPAGGSGSSSLRPARRNPRAARQATRPIQVVRSARLPGASPNRTMMGV